MGNIPSIVEDVGGGIVDGVNAIADGAEDLADGAEDLGIVDVVVDGANAIADAVVDGVNAIDDAFYYLKRDMLKDIDDGWIEFRGENTDGHFYKSNADELLGNYKKVWLSDFYFIGDDAFRESSITDVKITGTFYSTGESLPRLERDRSHGRWVYQNFKGNYMSGDIGDGVFRDCINLQHVTIQNGVIEIGIKAFTGCINLTDVTFTKDQYYRYDWGGVDEEYQTSTHNVHILWTIEETAFRKCSALTYMAIPDSVKWIKRQAFEECSALESLTLPLNNEYSIITEGLCRSCFSLTSIIIPNTVITIETQAFHGCSALTSVVIPDSVRNIGTDVFASSGLTTVYMTANNQLGFIESTTNESFYGKIVKIIIFDPAVFTEGGPVPDVVTITQPTPTDFVFDFGVIFPSDINLTFTGINIAEDIASNMTITTTGNGFANGTFTMPSNTTTFTFTGMYTNILGQPIYGTPVTWSQ